MHACSDFSLPPPFADVTPSNVKPKSVLTKAWDMMGYVTSSLTSHMLPFQKEYADCRKNAFRSKLVTTCFTAEGERNSGSAQRWSPPASRQRVSVTVGVHRGGYHQLHGRG